MITMLATMAPCGFCAEPGDPRLWAISTVVGTGQPEPNGMTGRATDFHVGDPFGVELGPDGHLYICEVRNHRLLRWDMQRNLVTTVAGTGEMGYSGDGGPANRATMNEPYEVRFDQHGNIYVVEMRNHVVRRIDAVTQQITTVVGTGHEGFSGDGGPAIRGTLNQPHSIALYDDRWLFVADIGNHRIRAVDLQTGLLSTVAGNGERQLPLEGESLSGRPLLGPRALHIVGSAVWLGLREGHSVWRCDATTWSATKVAGTGKQGKLVPSVAALSATFDGPKGIVSDGKRYVYVVDTENHAIRQIDTESNMVTTVAGTGSEGNDGDGGPAIAARLARPHGICLDADGAIYVGDTLNHRVRKIRQVESP